MKAMMPATQSSMAIRCVKFERKTTTWDFFLVA